MKIEERLQALTEELNQKFPDLKLKDGGHFDRGYENTLWTGEGSYMPDGCEAFDPHHLDIYEKKYIMGVHKELMAVLDAHNFYAEAHDAGTYFIREC